MENNKIYKQILALAKEIVKDNNTFTRADLAYELSKFGINQDSLEVSRLVMNAYEFFHKDENIRKAFCNNEGERSLIDEFMVSQMMKKGQHDHALKRVDVELKNGKASLHQLNKLTQECSVNVNGERKFELASWLTGTKGVENVKAEAEVYFDRYSLLVNGYSCAKEDVKGIIAEFVNIRGFVADIYQEYATKLVDIFGDSIKSVAPELFDFDTVEYLNVNEMHKTIRLKYDMLAETCAILIQDIHTNFIRSASESARRLGSGNSRESRSNKLMLAAVNMANHYMYASERTAQSKRELEKFKQDIKHDVALIAGDYTRLASVYKILNDLYIPKANTFYKYCKEVFQSELQQLFDTLYQNEEISKLAKKRDTIGEDCRILASDIADHQLHIEYYSSNIATGQELLKYKQRDYNKATGSKPQKPFFLVNLLTLGNSNRNYRRNLYEWKEYSEPVIIEYDKYKAEIKLDSDELVKHKFYLKKAKDELHLKKAELKRVNRQIASRIRVSNEIKLKMCDHLGKIVSLLHIAKDIVESKLDAKHVKTISVQDFRKTELPSTIEDNLNLYTDSLRNSLLAPIVSTDDNNISSTEDENIKKEEYFSEAYSQTVERSLGLLGEWSRLKLMREQGKMVQRDYDQALQNIRAQFENEMKETDNKYALLAETIKRVNLSANKEELKEALLSLNNEEILSMEDLEEFLI